MKNDIRILEYSEAVKKSKGEILQILKKYIDLPQGQCFIIGFTERMI